ncbi:MAG: T9SS type A sorting domain-containing protein, partial [bacterium]
GLRIMDISDPTDPVEVGYYDTGDRSWGVYAAGKRIYLADGNGGFYILKNDLITSAYVAAFQASRQGVSARLQWRLAGEATSARFLVWRQTGDEPRVEIGAVDMNGPSAEFVDPSAPTSEAAYWLQAVRENGVGLWFGPAPLAAANLPAPSLHLAQNRPNPFNPGTTLEFSTAAVGHVRFDLYDSRGRLVVTLVDAVLSSGQHTATWDGRDQNSRAVGSGTYLARLVTANGVQTRKLALAR